MGNRLLSSSRPAAVVVAAALLGLAGCGSDDASGDAQAASAQVRPAATPSAAAATPAPPPRNVFPVQAPKGKVRYGKAHHDYPATDIFAPCGSAVLAPMAGTVVEVAAQDVWSSRKNEGEDRGGISWSLAGVDGVRYYGSHLKVLAAAVKPGVKVTAGQVLGEVGDTGSARGTSCHLHFGLSPVCGPGDWWTRRGVVAPYPYLKAWQKGEPRSPVAAVTAWRDENGCPATAEGVPYD